MRRFLAALRCDVIIQYRSGFYWVGLAAVLFWLAVLSQIKQVEIIDFGQWLGVFLATNLVMTTFFFVAGLTILEKAEGALDGLVVTPLRPWEYLWSKALTLSVLAAVETAGAILLVYDGPVLILPMLLGLFSLGAIYTLFGIAVAVRYDAINSFLPPAIVGIVILSIPLVPHFELWSHPVLELHPAEPAFKLFRLALDPSGSVSLVSQLGLYALFASVVWLGLSYAWARSAFAAFIVRRAGG